MKRYALATLLVALAASVAGPTQAQEVPPPPDNARKTQSDGQLVRVQLVLMRYQGEKKTASIPYVLVAATGNTARLRMGVNVPIVVTPGSYQYKDVGTNIDCRVDTSSAGRYDVGLHVENTSTYRGPAETSTSQEAAVSPDRAMFRSFSVHLQLVMRDGQTLQTVASTDPVTGEVVKIDVTLNVVK